jgi:hypothetical protein
MAKLEKQSASPPPGQVKHDDHSIGTLDASSYQGSGDPHPGEMWFNFPGSGNLPTNFNISTDSKTGIELGLKIHEYRGADIIPTSVDADGTAHYTVPDGTSPLNAARAAWNFDFSVNSGTHNTLDNFDFRITIKSGDGEVGTFDLQHLAPGNTPWLNASLTAGFGDEDGANTHLSQNSVNLNFAFLSAIFGADALNAGETYDITLQAFDHGKIVAQVHDAIILA